MAEQSYRERLEALRDTLAREIEDTHSPGCPCECGVAGDARTLAALSKEYRATLAEIEALPVDDEAVSESAALKTRVQARWGDRRTVA